ncbi:MAG: O-antigen ligase family protein [Capnocytophaga felis]|nr:O-antigen ligase family protein [Capnocytophaga felis]
MIYRQFMESLEKKLNNVIGEIINYLPVLGCLSVLSTDIFYISNTRDLWYVIPITLLIEFIYNKRWKTFTYNKMHIYYGVVFLFFLLFFLYYPFEQHTLYFDYLLKTRIPLSGLALCGILGLTNYHKLSYYLNAIIVVALFSIFYLVVLKIGFFEFLNSGNRAELFTQTRISFVNHHMKYNIYLNLALVSIWYIVSNKYKSLSKIKWIFYVCSFLLIFSILHISEGRNGYLTSLFIVGCISLVETWKRSKFWAIFVGGIVIILIFFKISSHGRLSENDLKENPRIFLWEIAWETIKENPLLGRGASEAQYVFTEKRLAHPLNETYQYFYSYLGDYMHADNQYFQTTMEFGFMGLILLLIIYFYPFFLADKKHKILAFLMIFVIAFQSFFTVVLTDEYASLVMIMSYMILLVKDDVVIQRSNDITTS